MLGMRNRLDASSQGRRYRQRFLREVTSRHFPPIRARVAVRWPPTKRRRKLRTPASAPEA